MITGSIGMPSKSGGGGGGKMIQKIPLEAGDVYNLVGTWKEIDVPTSIAFDRPVAVIGNFAYVTDSYVWRERNLSDNSIKNYLVPTPPSVQNFINAFSYNNQLYCMGNTGSIYRINLSTLTTTLIVTIVIPGFVYNSPCTLFKQVTDTKILLVSRCGIVEFDFLTNKFVYLMTLTAALTGCAVIQKAPDGDYLIGLNIGGVQTKNIHVYKYFVSSGSLSSLLGTIEFPEVLSSIQAIQLGEKMMYVTDKLQAGKYTGELDLVNLTVNPIKYANTPAGVPLYSFNGFEYQNQYIFYSANKKYWLPLLQTPPEENALRLKIFKGQKYNIGYGAVHINALSAIGQEAFELTIHQQTAKKDLYIYDGMYQLFQDKTILIESE